ncbi:MAG TPA: SH3 domain-containing protein [Acidimicrobiales bacterium]|nr:SH3 domain-containing protein [Acidimicrobiales bacterium]
MFEPDHRSPADGLPAWDTPDPSRQPVATIGAGLQVQLVERRNDGWAKVLCDNGWAAWVDAGRLQPIAAGPPGVLYATMPPAPPPEVLHAPVRIRGVRISAPLLGGALIVAGAFLPWVSQLTVAENAFGIPIEVLFDPKSQPTGGLKLGFVLVPLGAVVLATGLARLPLMAARIAGGVAALIATMFLGQLQRAMGQAQVATVFGVLGLGVYVTMLAGVVAAMSKRAPST